MASESSVSYLLNEGTLNIVPSSNILEISQNEGVSEGTLLAKNGTFASEISVPKIKNGDNHVVENGTLSGIFKVGENGGEIDTSNNRIVGMTKLNASTLTSGSVSIDTNNISGVSKLTANEILSENFTVKSSSVEGVTSSTMTGDVVHIGKPGSLATIDNTTLTGLTSLDVSATGTITSGSMKLTGNRIYGASEVVSATLTDGSGAGRTVISEGTMTTTKGVFATARIDDIDIGTLRLDEGSIGSLTIGSVGIANGTISDVTKIIGSTLDITEGVFGGSTLSNSNITGVSSIDTTTLSCGTATLKKSGAVVSLTNVGSISSSTITDGNVVMTAANITGVSNMTASSANITAGTIGGVLMYNTNITGVTNMDASTLTCGPAVMKQIVTDDATQCELIKMDNISSKTITDGSISMNDGTLTGIKKLNVVDSSVTNSTITKMVSGAVLLQNNNLSGISNSTMSNATIGNIVISDTSIATGFTEIDTEKLKCDTTTLMSNTLSGLSNIVLSDGEIKNKNVVIKDNNISDVSTLSGSQVLLTSKIKADSFVNNAMRFRVEDNGTLTTTTTNVLKTADITVDKNSITGASSIDTVKLTSGATTLMGNTLSGLTSLTSTAMSTGSISLGGGDISGVGTVTSLAINATSATATNVITGDLMIKGDLRVVNNSAKVIELSHEQMSTKDPIMEFNTGLGSTEISDLTNTSFGFVNVMKTPEDVKTAAGLVSRVVSDTEMEFTFFRNSTYPTADTNDYLRPGSFSLAPIKCHDVTSNGRIKLNNNSSYLSIGAGTERTTEMIYAAGDVRGVNIKSAGHVDVDDFLTVGSGAVRSTERIVTDGKIKTVTLETTNFTQTSDARKKKNVFPINDALSAIELLNPVTFNWKSDDKADVGFIAQEMREVYPELVEEDSAGFLSVAYTGIVAPLVRAMQQQQKMIEDLQHRLDNIEGVK